MEDGDSITRIVFPLTSGVVLQDEQSAVSMLKKHQILEQAVEDYAETVHQLSKTSRSLVADGHPERSVLFVLCFLHDVTGG